MPIKKYKPTSPGTRWRIGNAYKEITKCGPEKSLLAKLMKTGGRNSSGRMTVRYRGGGHKKNYRIIDFKREKKNISAKVSSIEYDPNRTAFIALVVYKDGEKRYILAPQGLSVGDTIESGEQVPPDVGNSLPLKNIPLGTIVHNIEMQPGNGGIIARSAGSSAQLTNKEDKYAILKLPSHELRKVLINCYATVGVIGNSDHAQQSMGKAGRNRWRGIRPRTRGVAKNPVDHPMGGGEGKASGGQPRSISGQYSKGLKTRKKKKDSNKFIIQRRDGSKIAK